MNTPRAAEDRVSMLIELLDEPGALAHVLNVFSHLDVNLTHIESRPARGNHFDFYVDCEGQATDAPIAAAIAELRQLAEKILILDEKKVPWFPRHVAELALIAGNTLDAGTQLHADHPGVSDQVYLTRRGELAAIAGTFIFGEEIPRVSYTDEENATWRSIFEKLQQSHQRYACREYLDVFKEMERHCQFVGDQIPAGEDISRFLFERTGFQLWPVAGLLSSRDFLNGLAFRMFFSTQYIRHSSRPLYTPEPDICHELIGHAPMFADPAFADLSHEIGLASLGATDAEIECLARCYWHSVEFGLVMESGERKAYGAGVLSSVGEMTHALGNRANNENPVASTVSGEGDLPAAPQFRDFDPSVAAKQPFPITDYQPVFFVAESLQQARSTMREYAINMPRPFYARYNAPTQRIWVDRAIDRQSAY